MMTKKEYDTLEDVVFDKVFMLKLFATKGKSYNQLIEDALNHIGNLMQVSMPKILEDYAGYRLVDAHFVEDTFDGPDSIVVFLTKEAYDTDEGQFFVSFDDLKIQA
jgi:hypothetical protein